MSTAYMYVLYIHLYLFASTYMDIRYSLLSISRYMLCISLFAPLFCLETYLFLFLYSSLYAYFKHTHAQHTTNTYTFNSTFIYMYLYIESAYMYALFKTIFTHSSVVWNFFFIHFPSQLQMNIYVSF